jgi:hypothetical protein
VSNRSCRCSPPDRDPLLVAGVDGCATVSGSTARVRFGNVAGWAVGSAFAGGAVVVRS